MTADTKNNCNRIKHEVLIMKSQNLVTGLAVLIIAFFAIPAEAHIQQPPQFQPPPQEQPQIEVSDDELQAFIDASMNAQTVQVESQEEMVAVVDNEGIGVETYNEIMQAQQTGQAVEELDVSEKDVAKFERAQEQIQEIEEEMMGKLAQAIEEKGMEMERFQEINMAIQQDPELQQRVQQKVQESQMQNQPPPQPQQQ